MSRAGQLAAMEVICATIGGSIGMAIDEAGDDLDGVGFALLMFEFGDAGKWSTYISNAQRGDMIKALRECADNIEGGLTAEPGTGGRLPS